jgi:hypothetical protein
MIRTSRTAACILTAALPVAAVLGAGPVYATTEQPGVTEPAPQPGLAPAPDEQAGVSAPTPPPRPPTQSLAGDLVPDPPTYAPSDYRSPSSDDGPSSRTLGQDLVGLHAPAPVRPSKVIVPPPPDYLGVGAVKIPRPPQVPIDLAWKINGYLAGAQRTTDTFFNSIGFSSSRSDRMATAGVLCAAGGFGAGALLTGVPAAVAGALVGSTIGGTVGAGLGTFVPVPIVGTITSGVAGTVIGSVAGAVVAGIPVAIVGGTITALPAGSIGVLTTAGDGSDNTRPPAPAAPPAPAPAPPSRPAPAPGPDVHAQVQQVADAGVHTAENAVHLVQAQPGGEQTLNVVADAGAAVGAALAAAPGAAQVGAAVGVAAHNVVAAAKAAPATSAAANAVADVVLHHPAFTPQEFGPLTGAANAALVAAQAVVR